MEHHNILNEESSSSSEETYHIDVEEAKPIPNKEHDFNHWVDTQPTVVENIHILSDNPAFGHNSSSDSDNAQNSSITSATAHKRKRHKYKKYSYDEIVESLTIYYGDSKHVNEMDIIMLYIMGQKHLYMQATRLTNLKLYSLYIAAISMTALGTVMAPLIRAYWWNYIAISTCNAIATALLSLMNYLKLEANASKYKYIANHYESFENSLEIVNSKLSHLNSESDRNALMLDTLRTTEIKINESRELNQTLIPTELKELFTVITHINIFSFIKKMGDHKQSLIRQYRDKKNLWARTVYYHDNPPPANSSYHNILKPEDAPTKISELAADIETYKEQIIKYRKAYAELEKLIYREIRYSEKHANHIHCAWWYPPTYLDPNKYENQVIVDFLRMLAE